MDEFMKGILSRVLSEEIAKQQKWADREERDFGMDRSNREDNVKRIQEFMDKNEIKFREDFYMLER